MTASVTIHPGRGDGSVYGPVEIAWHSDCLRITALGAWRAAVSEEYAGGGIAVEIRPPAPDEQPDEVPGAD